MFLRIKPELLKFLKRKEVALGLEEEAIKSNWHNIIEKANKSAHGRSIPTHITKDRVLIVKAADNMWMQELSFLKEDIKKEINKKSHIVEDIRFTI